MSLPTILKQPRKILVEEHSLAVLEPMLPECLVSVCIPVYNEPIGLLLRVLLSLAAQKGIRKDDYDVFIIVNNNRRQAEEKSAEFLQNQKTLAFLAYISRKFPDCPFELNQAQRQAVSEIRNSGLRVYFIDKSSLDFADELNNCGSSKNYGGMEICRRFKKNSMGEKGIIALLDCDCRVSENFVKEISETFKEPEVNLVAGKWLTEPDPNQAFPEAFERAAAIHFGADSAFKNFKVSGERLPVKLQKRGKAKKSIAKNGHNMAVKAAAWLAVGGFPKLSSFDDIIFGQRVAELPGDVAYNPNYWVCNMLRSSERAGSASIGRRMKTITESIERFALGGEKQILLPDLREMNRLFLVIARSLRKNLLTPESLLGHLKTHGVAIQNLKQRDVADLHAVIVEEFRDMNRDHGWERTEALVLSRFYKHFPKRVFRE